MLSTSDFTMRNSDIPVDISGMAPLEREATSPITIVAIASGILNFPDVSVLMKLPPVRVLGARKIEISFAMWRRCCPH